MKYFTYAKIFTLILLCIINSIDVNANSEKASKIEYVKNLNQFHPLVKYKAELPFGAVFLEETAFSFVFRDSKIDELYHAMICKDQKHVHSDIDISMYNSIDDLVIPKHAYRVSFLNTLDDAKIQPTEKLTKYFNYFYGNDRSRWQGKVPGFSTITYQNLYANIDVKVFSEGSSMKYDIVLKPGSNVNDIAFQYDGLDNIHIKDGHLLLETSVGVFQEVAPYTYQIIDGELTTLPSAYVLNNNILTFEIDDSKANKNYDIIIDPVLVGATYSGSTTTNYGWSAAYDSEGNIYSGGQCFGDGFPATLGAFQEVFNPGGGGYYGGVDDCITKFNPDGTAQIYATYLGGADSDLPNSLFVADNNELIVFGSTRSNNFPVSANAYQNIINTSSGYYYYYSGDAYITRFTEDGSNIIGSTFFGGTDSESDDYRGDIAVTENNDIIIAFSTNSIDMPTNSNTFQPNYNGGGDAFIARFNADLTSLIWGSYFGGSSVDYAYNMHLDNSENIYITGFTYSPDLPTTVGAYQETSLESDASYVAHIASDGTSILAATYISHLYSGGNFYDGVRSYFVDQDNQDNVWIFGTAPPDFPVDPPTLFNNPNSGQFIAELSSGLTNMYKSTIFGSGSGLSDLTPSAFMVDYCNNVYACGYGSTSCDMPVTADAYSSCTPGSGSFYFLVLDSTATELKYGTHYGSSDYDHNDGGSSRFDKRGIVYQAICTSTSDAPTAPDAYSTDDNDGFDIYVFKFDFDILGLSANAEAQPSSGICLFNDIQFNSLGYGGLTFLWDFDDGTTSTLENPIHNYSQAGFYSVSLVVTDSSSCLISDTALIDIQVLDCGAKIIGESEFCSDADNSFSHTIVGSPNASYIIWHLADGSQIADVNSIIINKTNNNCEPIIESLVLEAGLADFVDFDTLAYTVYPTNIEEFVVTQQSNNSLTASIIAGCSDYVNLSNEMVSWQDGEQNSVSIEASYVPQNLCTPTYNITPLLTAIETTINQTISIYPLPFDEQLSISLNNFSKSDIQISIYNIAGQQELNQFFNTNSGTNNFYINTSDLSVGVYFIQFKIENVIYTDKIIKE